MGEVGKFFLGGSTSKQRAANSSEATSQQASQNSSVQAARSLANNFQRSGSSGYNQAYAPVASAMTPALGYTTQAGNMMAALLGLPPSGFSYTQTPYTPGSTVLPPKEGAGGGGRGRDDLGPIIEGLSQLLPTAQTPPSPATPAPAPTSSSSSSGSGGSSGGLNTLLRTRFREFGGPVRANEPYIVGEKRPEVFVPDQPGTILPAVPQGMRTTSLGLGAGPKPSPGLDVLLGRPRGGRGGRDHTPFVPPGVAPPAPTPAPAPPVSTAPVNPPYNPVQPTNTDALNTFSNSAGMNFILDQGQKAVSGAAAGGGYFNSGATGKALQSFGQNLGKTYLQQYMQNLVGLGQLGLGAGSAMTGAGGVNQSQSVGGGTSSNVSGAVSQGSSLGSSNSSSQGTSTGSGSQKNGLLPALASFVPGAPRG